MTKDLPIDERTKEMLDEDIETSVYDGKPYKAVNPHTGECVQKGNLTATDIFVMCDESDD